MTLSPRSRRLLGLFIAVAAITALTPLGLRAAVGDPAPATATSSAAERHGQLHVCGTHLCDDAGQPVQLRGMSTHGLQWYSQCVDGDALDALAADWRADVVRLSMYIQEGGYETDPRRFTDLMHRLIDEVSARGMYVIVDWHMLSPGDPHHNLERATAFFTEIAREHGHRDNLLYEVANEPNGVPWSRIKTYHEQIIPVIRRHDPDAVILLGTADWSSFGVSGGSSEQEVIDDPVDAANIMYTFHFYAASHRDAYLDALSRAADRLPVFVTEFGTQDYAGEGPNDFAMSQRYLDLMERKGISWVNWNFSDDHRSGAVLQTGTCPGGPYAGTSRLKEAGVWIRDRIRDGGTPAEPTTGAPSQDPTGAPGEHPVWSAGTAYAAGDHVTYGGASYRCLQSHTSLPGWEPPAVPALWAQN